MTSKTKMNDMDGQDSGLVVATAMHPTELQHVKAGIRLSSLLSIFT